MTDIPPGAIEAAADAIMSAGNFNDDEPERFEARTLARAALEAATPLLAEAWGVKRRKPVLPEGFAASNAALTRAAGHRDAGSAVMILARPGNTVSARQRLVAEARIASPEASWTEIGARTGMTKDQAVSLFRRMLRTARQQMERERRDR